MADYEPPIRLFSVEVNMVATAYIFATSEAVARELVTKELTNCGDELSQGGPVDGRAYAAIVDAMGFVDDESRVTLSPAVTFVGPCDGADYALEEQDIGEDA